VEYFQRAPEWNTTAALVQVLQELDNDTCISYQVTQPIGGGIVSSRDLVVIRRTKRMDEKFVIGYASIKLDDIPAQKNAVR
jgi:hypothetical protein